MKYYIIFLFTLFIANSLSSQNLRGRITDSNGEPLYGSTIYIRETNQGIVCNEDGYYQITLQPGSYNIEYKCLGFKQVERQIRIIENSVLTENITLEENPFILNEVVISNEEDPAYGIMRKAIDKAPYYLNIVSTYTAEAYIKENMELHSISKLADKMFQKSEGVKASDLKNQTFVQETFNEIQFTAPDKYKQTVKAFSSSIPDNFDSKDAIGIINGSLYMPRLRMFISPLNKNAFSYYRFRYEGFSEEGNLIINKIRIIPKVKDPTLFDGYIYIADGSWHIHSADLTSNVFGVKENYSISYKEIKKDIFLPTTFLIVSNITTLGINATMNYYASIKYNNLKVNENIINRITNKEKKEEKKTFEIIKSDSLYILEADSLAEKRDSSYWTEKRIVPLANKEKLSFIKKDSIQQYIDSVRKDNKKSEFSLANLIIGGKIGSDSSKIKIKYDGLLLALPEYNFVDGPWLGQKFIFSTKLSKTNILKISPYVYYVTARKRIIGGGDIQLTYAPKRLGQIDISIASTSTDFNPIGTSRLDNMYGSLLSGNNRSFFYQNDYITVKNKIDLINGLNLSTGITVAKRSGLRNNTEFSLWGTKRNTKANIYDGERFDKTSYFVKIEYTPYAYYSIQKGVKNYEYYTSPTFFINYKEGFSSWQKNNSKYRQISGGIHQSFSIDYFSRLEYSSSAGTFLGNRKKVHFADYHHFDITNILSTTKNPFDSYLLGDSYYHSTNRYWIDTKINYTSKYILLKRLPFLQGKMFTESLHLKSLYTPDKDFYSEAGYSINLTKYICAGIYSSFDNLKFNSCNFRLSIDIKTIKSVIDN